MQRNELANVSLEIPTHDYTCSITGEIFFEPEMTIPCGHLFEKEAIDRSRVQDKNCPCCRQLIKDTTTAPVVFFNQLDTLLRIYPHLQKQQYFSLSALKRALQEQNKLRLDRLISIIQQRELSLTYETDKRRSIAYYIFESAYGAEYLSHNVAFRSSISSECLNQYSSTAALRDTTNLSWLVSKRMGISLLISDAELRNKITSQGLNLRVTGHIDTGSCALLWLCKCDKQATLLTMDITLRGKITEEGLNAINPTSFYNIQKDNDQGLSVAFFLALSEEGMTLLSNDALLRSKISVLGLNTIGEGAEYKGQSLVYLLAKSEQGRTILLYDVRIRSLIDSSTLNHKAESTGQSAADLLCACKTGKELLERDPILKAKIIRPIDQPIRPGFFNRLIQTPSREDKRSVSKRR